jgi:hypothetical protein
MQDKILGELFRESVRCLFEILLRDISRLRGLCEHMVNLVLTSFVDKEVANIRDLLVYVAIKLILEISDYKRTG